VFVASASSVSPGRVVPVIASARFARVLSLPVTTSGVKSLGNNGVVGSTTPWGTVLPSSFTYLASSTISTYVPTPLYNTLFFLMRSAIWIMVLFHIYHRIRPKHATQV